MAENKEGVGRTLLVAFLVCLVCAVVVSTAAVTLRPVQEKNKKLNRQENILAVAGLYKQGMTGKDVQKVFERIDRRFVKLSTGEYVQEPESYDQRKASHNPKLSRKLTEQEDIADIKRIAKVAEVYLVHNEQGKLTSIILPIHGYGLWSTLYGFLALKPDVDTVVGLSFYEEGETPGLGGKVNSPEWKAKWPGKKIFDKNGDVAIQVIKGQVGPNTSGKIHKVDGLSGATLTTKGVDHLVRFWVGQDGFGPYLDRMKKRYRNNQQDSES